MEILNPQDYQKVESLSIEDINALLEQLENIKEVQPEDIENIEVQPQISFEEQVELEYQKTKKELEDQYKKESEIDKKVKLFEIATNKVLSYRINSELALELKSFIKKSRVSGEFNPQFFYGKYFNNQEYREVGKVVFASFRKYNREMGFNKLDKKRVNQYIKEAHKVETPKAQSVLNDFISLDLI